MQFLIPLIIIFFCYISISLKVLNNNFFKPKKKQKRLDELETKVKFLDDANFQIENESNQTISKVNKKINEQNEQEFFRQHRSSKNINKSKIKTIKLTSSVILLYIICSTPYFIGILLNVVLNSSQFMRLSKCFLNFYHLLFIIKLIFLLLISIIRILDRVKLFDVSA